MDGTWGVLRNWHFWLRGTQGENHQTRAKPVKAGVIPKARTNVEMSQRGQVRNPRDPGVFPIFGRVAPGPETQKTYQVAQNWRYLMGIYSYLKVLGGRVALCNESRAIEDFRTSSVWAGSTTVE